MNASPRPFEPFADWQLIWNDEFNGPAGQSPDPGQWTYDVGTNWGNNQLEFDTDRPENVSLDGNGNLAIIAREETYMGQAYTSARILTRGLYEQRYGRIEARIKLPIGQGIWPAFWMLGNDFGTAGWPQCGEIDIMEYRGQEPDIVHGSLHGPGYSAGDALTQQYALANDRFDTAFHVFAVEWEENVIRWYRDDVLYFTVAPDNLDGNEWVFDHPFYMILNVAVGGTFVGSPDGSTVFPQTMLVDYVRVYQNGSNDTEHEIALGQQTMSTGTWISIDIPLSEFRELASKEHLAQLILSGDMSNVFVDNVYFYNAGSSPVPTVPAPTPTVEAADVISIFSDAYANVPVDTWSASWDQADVDPYSVGGNNVMKYSNLVYAGIEFTTSPIIASGMKFFHMDVWTPDTTAAPAVFKVKLVDFGANGVWDGGGDDVEHEVILDDGIMNTGSWVSIELELTEFTDLITRGHLAQLIISGDPNTVFVDNVLLHR